MTTAQLRALLALTCIGALAIIFAASGGAAPPSVGNNCVNADGKISGRGATFANTAQATFARGFRDDVCGPASADALGSPPNNLQPGISSPNYNVDGNTHIAYNYWNSSTTSGSPALQGSGAGVNAAICRTDAFAMSDLPYNNAQLTAMNGAPGGTACTQLSDGAPTTPNGALVAPYQPTPKPWPATPVGTDATRNVMSFPVAGGAVALGINLTTAACPGSTFALLSGLQLTASMVSQLLGGEIANWNDPVLRAGGVNAVLANCDVPVKRFVRQDNSGTTQILKNYLTKVDNNRAGAACSGAFDNSEPPVFVPFTWASYNGSENRLWPRAGNETAPLTPANAPLAVAGDADCSPVQSPTSSGTGPLLTLCALPGSLGGVCYADVADVFANAALFRPNLRNALNSSFQAPSVGTRSNCNFATLAPPTGGANGWVGLTPGDSWSTNQTPNPNRGDVTNQGSAYPICGLTFALVHRGNATCDAVSRLTDNQCRTLYSYFTYILSSVGQERLNGVRYASLPTASVGLIRSGYQTNF